jgi:hypothetical protein
VASLACDIPNDEILGFGLVVTWTTPHDIGVQPGGPVAGYRWRLRVGAHRGRVWAHVRDPTGVMDGMLVNYRPATGEVQATGGIAVPNALFRNIEIALPDTAAAIRGSGRDWRIALLLNYIIHACE